MGSDQRSKASDVQNPYDAVIVGGGHNGLVAACYLAGASKRVLLLEKNQSLGGASVSQRLFPDFDARISRYAYLISLFPDRVIRELGLKLALRQRPISSYTPHRDGDGLLLSNQDRQLNEREIRRLGAGDWRGYQALMAKQRAFARIVWPSLLEPLKSRLEWQAIFRAAGCSDLWRDFVERPIGELIESHISSDLLRGVVFTDGKIGSSAGALDASLLQNRTYLYHIVGNGTGEWRVPEGGMGQLSDQLAERARTAGVEWRLGAEVIDTHAIPGGSSVFFRHRDGEFEIKARHLVWNATPPGRRQADSSGIDEGTSFKINMLLKNCRGRPIKESRPSRPLPALFTSTRAIGSSSAPGRAPGRALSPTHRPEKSTATPSPTRPSCPTSWLSAATTR